ncbi:MAG: flagellar hook-basal body complex protein FliE [Sphingomonas sp.]
MAGLRAADAKVAAADGLVRRFAIDDSVPVHQVTMALGEARLAVEMAVQVRDRLVESYREIMNMPL